MPYETRMDFNSLSSSLYSSEDSCSSTERQAGIWKSDKLFKGYDSDQGIRPKLSVQAVSKFSDSSEVNITGDQNEGSLFSSSLSELFSRKLRLSVDDSLYGHSVDTFASSFEEDRLFEELEARIIGNLLPEEDDLLSGVTDGYDHIIRESACDEMDELDLFSSVGGLDLGDDDSSSSGEKNSKIVGGACNSQLGLCNTSIAGENPYGEIPSRTLSVKNISSDVEDSELKALFEQFGDIHTFNRPCKHHGLVMISYYDIRAAQNAKKALRNRFFRFRKFEVNYSFPKILPELEPKKCSLCLHQKSPPPLKSTNFTGLHGVNKSGSMGGEPAMNTPSLETSFIHVVSSSVPNTLPSLARVKSVGNQCEITESSSPSQLSYDIQPALASHPHSLPEFRDGFANGVHRNTIEVAANNHLKTQETIDNMQFCQVNPNRQSVEFDECVLKSSVNGSSPLPSNHYKWSNSYQPPGIMWQNSPSYFDGICAAPTMQRLHQLPSSPSHMISNVLATTNRHVHSAPLWDRRYTYAGDSPEASSFHPGSIGIMPFSGNMTAHCVDFVPHNIFPHFGLHFPNQRGLIFPGRNHMINSFDSHKQRLRSRRNEGVLSLADMKQYELDIDRIKTGEDNRTTLMIKNIPNKYTSKMLLAAIDECHKGTYDFLYLPIDFKNKCNVGYAFINMANPSLIIPFYQVFNGKKWEKFNSEKVASLAYARIQGKEALIAHFQNSSLLNEDKRCRPILINTDGPNAGDQVPFPVSVNVSNKHGKLRNNTHEVNLQGSPLSLGNCKPLSGRDDISMESN